jgi:beta-N-acetylhexosaminidase
MLILLPLSAVILHCSTTTGVTRQPHGLMDPDYRWIEETLDGMTLEEKVGQLLMPVHRSIEGSIDLVKKYHVGGFWIARGKAEQYAEELNNLR